MDPRDFLKFATSLLASPTPAGNRSAISRAYYAAFNVGVERLRKLGFNIRHGAAAHGEVLHCLSNAGDREIVAAAIRLSDLHSHRNRADYQLDKVDIEQLAKAHHAVQVATATVEILDRVFDGPQAGQVKLTISNWRHANGYR